jgi:hypothetical protein
MISFLPECKGLNPSKAVKPSSLSNSETIQTLSQTILRVKMVEWKYLLFGIANDSQDILKASPRMTKRRVGRRGWLLTAGLRGFVSYFSKISHFLFADVPADRSCPVICHVAGNLKARAQLRRAPHMMGLRSRSN